MKISESQNKGIRKLLQEYHADSQEIESFMKDLEEFEDDIEDVEEFYLDKDNIEVLKQTKEGKDLIMNAPKMTIDEIKDALQRIKNTVK